MYKEIVVNVTDYETRVALLEDGTIVELYIERQDETDSAGNIYKGRVQRVLPGMQAAFVDIGLNQAAFIYVDDVLDEHVPELEALVETYGDDTKEQLPNADDNRGEERNRKIEDFITEGQELLVQVAKSPLGTKGARITSHVSLPGRFLVLMPTSDHIGISRRIEDETERQRLKDIVMALRQNQLGYIVRTAAEGIQSEKLASEMVFLINLWSNIQTKYKNAPTPALIHQELSVALRAVRDLLIQDAEKLTIDSRSGYESILAFLDTFMPSLKSSIELYDAMEPIFEAYNLEGDISRAIKRKVWLKSGGYIVMEHTEALVAIDVNTGRYVGRHNLEETITKTNLDAVKEIAYQIRLRDIGGIIVIDFIDMQKRSNQEKVFNALTEALKKDRSKTHVLPMSEMGLIQMTRKRVRRPLTQIMCEPCYYCEGESYQLSRQTICYNLYREVLRETQDMVGKRLTLRVHPEIAERLYGEENHVISRLEEVSGKQIVIYPKAELHMEEFDIIENLKE